MNPTWVMTKEACRGLAPSLSSRMATQKILAITTIALTVLCGTALAGLPLLLISHSWTLGSGLMGMGTYALGLATLGFLTLSSCDQWKKMTQYPLEHLIEAGPELTMKALNSLNQGARQAFYLQFQENLASMSQVSDETDREKFIRVFGKAGQGYTDEDIRNLEETLARITMAFSHDVLSSMETNQRRQAAVANT